MAAAEQIAKAMLGEWRAAGRCTACGLKGCYGVRGPWCPYMRRHTASGPVPPAYAHQCVPWPKSAHLAAAIRNGDDLTTFVDREEQTNA